MVSKKESTKISHEVPDIEYTGCCLNVVFILTNM